MRTLSKVEPEAKPDRQCRYGNSRALCRGPRRSRDKPYVAFIGGSATFGTEIAEPFPSLAEQYTGRRCINLGCIDGGIDTFNKDNVLLDICRGAELTVIETFGAEMLSNRFFSVHPQKTSTLTNVSTVMRAIYPEIDFSGISTVRDMIAMVYDLAPDRFEILVNEMRNAWSARMSQLITQVKSPVVLLVLAHTELSDAHWSLNPKHLQATPLFVTKSMVDDLRPLTARVVEVTLPDAGMGARLMRNASVASHLNAFSHRTVSTALMRALRTVRVLS